MTKNVDINLFEKYSSIIPASKTTEHSLGFLCFKLDEEEFGIDLNLISEIVLTPPITTVPRVKSYLTGVISIRGKVVSLVDFRQLLGFEPATITSATRVLLYESQEEQFGLIVDEVTLVKRVSATAFEQNPVIEENPITDKVIGIARLENNQQITVIDLEDIMNEALK